LIEFSGNRSGLRAMGAAACERVTSRYSVERAVEGTLAAIDAVMARG
jgi:hypothetical protein